MSGCACSYCAALSAQFRDVFFAHIKRDMLASKAAEAREIRNGCAWHGVEGCSICAQPARLSRSAR